MEYPVKTMNTNRANDIYQVDTGPVAFPDLSQRHVRHIDTLSLAFVVFNAPHFADFVLEAPTRVGDEQVYHYSKLVSLAAVKQALRGAILEAIWKFCQNHLFHCRIKGGIMYRVGVIGCRGIGNRHAQGAESLENAEVVAGCDLVPEQRDEFAAQFKATNPGLEMYGRLSRDAGKGTARHRHGSHRRQPTRRSWW